MRLNPILARELRQRLRGKRSVFVITAYLVLVTATMVIAYSASSSGASFGSRFGGDFDPALLLPTQAGVTGRTMFTWTLISMLGLLCLGLPTMAAVAICGERERDTLTPMLVTPLGPIRLVWGKLVSTLMFVLLMLIAALPIVAVTYLVGGVTIEELVLGYVGLIASAMLLASVGVGVSSLMRRTVPAVLLTNLIVATLLFGTLIGAEVLNADVAGGRHPLAARWPLLVNPVVMVADLVGDETQFDGPMLWDATKRRYSSPDSSLIVPSGQEWFEGDMGVGIRGAVAIGPNGVIDGQNGPDINRPWRKNAWNWSFRSLTACGLVSLMFLALAAFRLRTPAKKDR